MNGYAGLTRYKCAVFKLSVSCVYEDENANANEDSKSEDWKDENA